VAIFAQSAFEFLDTQQCRHQQPFEFCYPAVFLLKTCLHFGFQPSVFFSQLLGFFFGHIRSLLGLSAQSKGVLGSYKKGVYECIFLSEIHLNYLNSFLA
jgi:hypothetical protein